MNFEYTGIKSSLQQQPSTFLDSEPAGQFEELSIGQKRKDYCTHKSCSFPRVCPIMTTYCRVSSVQTDPIAPCFQNCICLKSMAEVQYCSSRPHLQASDRHCIHHGNLGEWMLLPPTNRHLCNFNHLFLPSFYYSIFSKARKYWTFHILSLL